jgi:hypothetical protein
VVTDPNAGPPGSGGANLTFEGSTSLSGDTAIISAPTSGGPVPPQFQLEGQFYHVITTILGTNVAGAAAGKFIFCAGYVETSTGYVGTTPEGMLQILHWNPGLTPPDWDDKTLTPRYKSVDAVPYSDAGTNVVCAEVDHLSEFALVSPASVGGLVSIVAGDSSSGVSTWLWAASMAGAIALATAGGWMVLERRRLH